MNLLNWLTNPDRPPLVMGVLNVTPDSFSDGGQWIDPAAAADRAGQMLADGAAIIDIGGESTRPGSQSVPEAEQICRVVPVIERLMRANPSAIVSIDTTRAAVAAAALDAGSTIVNDISAGLGDPALLPLVADRTAVVALMHMQGTPATMQHAPTYADVTSEVKSFLASRLQAAQSAGVAPSRVLLDPGIGFGKTVEHNLQLLRDLAVFTTLGQPLLVGTSRKGFIGRITGETDPADRLFGTAATVAWSIANGASIVRVHDVAPMARVVRMIQAIQKKA
ncbi:dihydropteroate synthase [soil metagenome]